MSRFTCDTVNDLVEAGMLFSYATARSQVTARKVTKGLEARIPLIVYNGAFVIDNVTGERMLSNFFGGAEQDVLDDLLAHDIFPIVYSFIDGIERFSYVEGKSGRGVMDFVTTRDGDPRQHPVKTAQELYRGEIFYISCIDEPEKLLPMQQKYRNQFHTVYQTDVYSGDQWLEIMPMAASKSNAIRQLKSLLNCDRLVVFGDGQNDLDMFHLADESYAVQNAVEDLKSAATAVIDSNDNDGVAKYLKERLEYQK